METGSDTPERNAVLDALTRASDRVDRAAEALALAEADSADACERSDIAADRARAAALITFAANRAEVIARAEYIGANVLASRAAELALADFVKTDENL